ncbi:CbiX/SirB N-terminal domain-containing protein [Cryobacterium sp. PH29-G1]|uniref:sirohydrochlorin chelatase n=1 Tax=Cryobacterium sp. PH29-G1 TaxID=3046211 RepID=UPI0024B87F55|nr:CbiX/SirB N-terminal domain-containing protein [Cryobacterium sp. PH29-G1]MDJ0349197.1 CbiX/SirB N-terminal domain-containing protein [Cryobacterium sp. PH29-G1]
MTLLEERLSASRPGVDSFTVDSDSVLRHTPLPAALVAISHGTNSVDGQAAIAALVDAVAYARPELAVTGGFVDVQQPDVAASLGAVRPDSAAVVVPLLLSAGYHVHVDLHRETRAHDRVTTLSRALGPDDRLIDVLEHRLRAAGFFSGPGQEVVLAAAGSSDERAVDDCRTVSALLEHRLGVRVTVGFLSAATPRLACAVAEARLRSDHVTVSTYLMAPGFFFDLTRTQGAGALLVTAPLLVPGETAPAPLVDLVIDRYLEAKEHAGLF